MSGGLTKDVLVWSVSDLSAWPSVGSSFTVTGDPDLMTFTDDEVDTVPSDFDPNKPNMYDPNQTLSGTLEGQQFSGYNGTTDVFEFEYAYQVTDGVNTFNIYQIDNDYNGGTTTAFVSEQALDPNATYWVTAWDDGVNFNNNTAFETTPTWYDLAGQVDGTAGDDYIGPGFQDSDADAVDGNDGVVDYIVGEGGSDTIYSGAGDDVVYGDAVSDIPAGTTEYVLQGFFRDTGFELESGTLATGQADISINSPATEIRIIDNDGQLNGDQYVNEVPSDADQLIEINGVLYSFSADFTQQFTGDDGNTYTMLVVDVDRDFGGNIDTWDATNDAGDVDYENGQILIPMGAVPPAGVWLTAVGSPSDATNPNYADLGATQVTAYNDSINAGSGDDRVFGGQGDDTIDGGTGNDTLDGGQGSDTFELSDGFGNDSIIAGEDAGDGDVDVVDASGVTAGGVTVTTAGESGTITQGTNSVSFSEVESFTLTSQDDSFDATGTTPVTVDGGAGADTISGGDGDDMLVGGDGDDLFQFEDNFGNDTVYGGNVGDTDTIDFSGVTSTGVDVTFSQSEDGTATDGTNTVTFDNIEAVTGTNQADTIDASADNSGVELQGGGGDDSITGGSVSDTLGGGTGSDTLAGGGGADLLDGGAGDDDIAVGGADTAAGGTGDDVFTIDPTDPAADVAAVIDGGSDATDGNPDDAANGDAGDVLDLSDQTAALDVTFGTNPEAGTVDGLDATTGDADITFAEIEAVNTGSGDDTIDGTAATGPINVNTGGGDDSLTGGSGGDSLAGGAGTDTLAGGEGADLLDGGGDDDTLTMGVGDTAVGGDGDDVFMVDPTLDEGPGTITVVGGEVGEGGADTTNDNYPGASGPNGDVLDLRGLEVVSFNPTGGDPNSESGTITVLNDAGDQITIVYSEIEEVLMDPQPDGVVDGEATGEVMTVGYDDGDGPTDGGGDLITNGADSIEGNGGNDTIDAGAGNDTIDGGADNDIIAGGLGDDSILGGAGDDTLNGGAGADVLDGGLGDDLFVVAPDEGAGDVVTGGEDPSGLDNDVLDLVGSGVSFITYDPTDPTYDPTTGLSESGVVTFTDGSTLTFSQIETVIPCFTPGTRIATSKGERLVEELQPGDRVITRDNGYQEIAWVGAKELSGLEMVKCPSLKPILVKAGSLGGGFPERDMMLSPNHKVLLADDNSELFFEEREVLVAAKHLVGRPGIERVNVTRTSYIHFMFERHEVVLSDGTWSESFHPGDYALNGIDKNARKEILTLFPELATEQGLKDYRMVRTELKKHEAELLIG